MQYHCNNWYTGWPKKNGTHHFLNNNSHNGQTVFKFGVLTRCAFIYKKDSKIQRFLFPLVPFGIWRNSQHTFTYIITLKWKCKSDIKNINFFATWRERARVSGSSRSQHDASGRASVTVLQRNSVHGASLLASRLWKIPLPLTETTHCVCWSEVQPYY